MIQGLAGAGYYSAGTAWNRKAYKLRLPRMGMVKEPRYLYEYVKKMDAFVSVPTAKQLSREVARRAWFLGGELIGMYDPMRFIRASAALRHLKKRFGPPNTTLITPERDGVWQEKPEWEYILFVDAQFWFSIYEADGRVRLGFRILAPDDFEYLKLSDFEAGDKLCDGFFRFVDSILKRRDLKPLPEKEEWED